MSAASRFFTLRPTDQLRVLDAFFCLGLARAAVVTVPFRWLARVLGSVSAPAPPVGGGARPPSPLPLELVRWIETVSSHTPWTSNCLAKAIAAKLMLRRRGLKIVLHFGVAKSASGAIEAHAWTSIGDTILTGAREAPRFAALAVFAEDPAVSPRN